MIPVETLRKIRRTIRRLEITTRKIVDESLAGQYHSVFKGRGMEFDEVREYSPGDDPRSIDWNVTARMGAPFTKRYVEERELTVMLVVDASASMDFGSGGEFKNELAAQICALLAFSAIKNNDRVGLLIFTDRVELHLPPRKGRRHVLRLIREVLFFRPRGLGSDIAGALEYTSRTRVKKSVLFVLSDFMESDASAARGGFRKPLQLLARKHDVIALRLRDPREDSFAEGLGLLRLVDPESGQQLVVDTSNRRWRDDFARLRAAVARDLERFLMTNGIDSMRIDTDEQFDNELVAFFRNRARRRR